MSKASGTSIELANKIIHRSDCGLCSLSMYEINFCTCGAEPAYCPNCDTQMTLEGNKFICTGCGQVFCMPR